MTDYAQGTVLTPRLMEALGVAARAHDGHYRKGTDTPYMSHLCGVMYVAARQGLFDDEEEDILIACLLHDTLEDVPGRYSAEQMQADFGPTVLALVRALTKDPSIRDWRQRSEAYLAHLRRAPAGAVIVSACDKLHNLSSMLADHAVQGPALWGRFNCGRDAQLWWYRSVFEVVQERLPHLPLIDEYRRKLELLEQCD